MNNYSESSSGCSKGFGLGCQIIVLIFVIIPCIVLLVDVGLAYYYGSLSVYRQTGQFDNTALLIAFTCLVVASIFLAVPIAGFRDRYQAIDPSKSYVGKSVIALISYYLGFYIVGLILNVVFLSEANASRRIAGVSPSGRGCLVFLLWVHLILPILFVVAVSMGIVSMPFFR